MKAMILAFVAIAVIAVSAYYALDLLPYSSADRGLGSAVRLADTPRP